MKERAASTAAAVALSLAALASTAGEVACFGRGCGLGAGSLDAFGQGVRLALEGISDGYGSRRAALGPGDGFRHGRCRRKSAFRCQLREGRLGELPQGGSGLLGFGTTFGLVQKLVQERRDASPRPGPTVIHVGARASSCARIIRSISN